MNTTQYRVMYRHNGLSLVARPKNGEVTRSRVAVGPWLLERSFTSINAAEDLVASLGCRYEVKIERVVYYRG